MHAIRLQRLVWPGMILAGIVLAACVWAAWPVDSAPAASPPPAASQASFGPAPVRSELEQSVDYVQESPEQLGARPLPGAELTPEPPPVVG